MSLLSLFLSDSRTLCMANSRQLAGGVWRSPSLPPWHTGQDTEEQRGTWNFLRPFSWRGTVPEQRQKSSALRSLVRQSYAVCMPRVVLAGMPPHLPPLPHVHAAGPASPRKSQTLSCCTIDTAGYLEMTDDGVLLPDSPSRVCCVRGSLRSERVCLPKA